MLQHLSVVMAAWGSLSATNKHDSGSPGRRQTGHLIVAAFAVMTFAASCVSDVPTAAESAAAQPSPTASATTDPHPSPTASVTTSDSAPGPEGCVLDSAAVAEIVEEEIVSSEAWTQFLLTESTGCLYNTAGGGQFQVAEASGAPSADSEAVVAFEAMMVRGVRVATLEDVGDEGAFFARGGVDLLLLVGDQTIAVGAGGVRSHVADYEVVTVELARALHAIDDTQTRCDALPALLPAEWMPGTEVLFVTGGTVVSNTDTYPFESCRVGISIVPGASVGIMTSPGRGWFDDWRASSQDGARLVEGLGAAGVSIADRTFVRVGNRVAGIGGQPATADQIFDLATAVVAALSPTG